MSEYQLRGMRCAACASTIETGLRKRFPTAQNLAVSFATESLQIDSEIPAETVAAAVSELGYEAFRHSDSNPVETGHQAEFWRLSVGVAFAVPLIGLSMARDLGLVTVSNHLTFNLLLWALATPVQFYTGMPLYRGAWRGLKNRIAGMDLLLVLGSTVAYVYSIFALSAHHVYFEAAGAVIAINGVGRWLEARARERTKSSLASLTQLLTGEARVMDGTTTKMVPIADVAVGLRVLILAGERIPIDGEIEEGEAAVNESLLTGESLPVDKTVGSRVIGGSIAETGRLVVRASATAGNSVVAQIVARVRSAQATRTDIQGVADRIAGWMVPIVVTCAVLAFAMSYGLFGELHVAIGRLVAVLVIACPCALGLATPTALVVGMGRAAKSGILFRNSRVLETASRLTAIVFDKTGTLTRGRPTVVEKNVSSPTADLALASLESMSDHPIAKAISRSLANVTPSPVKNFRAFGGQGIQGEVDGTVYVAGSLDFLKTKGSEVAQADAAASMRDRGESVVGVAPRGEPSIGVYGIADELRAEAKASLAKLADKELWIVSGDHERAVQKVATELAIKNVVAGALPGTKTDKIQALKSAGHIVGMVGDGINDSPALSAADVGIALGSGNAVASEVAHITLLGGDLTLLTKALAISSATFRTIKQNLFWAFAYNVALIPIAGGVLAPFAGMPHWLRELPPTVAAGAMVVSSLFVVGNALRLDANLGRAS